MIDVYAYIKHYLNQRGYEHFTLQPVEVYFADADVRLQAINADNEFYFLMSDYLEDDTVIESDFNVFCFRKSNNYFRNTHFAQVFSGIINITVPASPQLQLIEFLRVIPVINNV